MVGSPTVAEMVEELLSGRAQRVDEIQTQLRKDLYVVGLPCLTTLQYRLVIGDSASGLVVWGCGPPF